ncbi:hypothetical protein ELY14_11110, partial [Legionella septentrionalis]|uniref:transposase n=1 Tax=Legionella septentrionalis TaxID=2498109 RepID=UPI000FB5EAED
MVRQLRKYSKEFKEESVKLAISYSNINKAADELGLPRPTLHEWVKKAKISGGYQDDSGLFQAVDVAKVMEENNQLKKRLARLEQEKSILKKAAANSIDHCNTSLNLSAGARKFNVFRGLSFNSLAILS